MQSITQPFIKLSTAKAELLTRFAQSPEIAKLPNTTAQKYLELVQQKFGGAAAADTHADLVRSLTENYSTFAREHAQNLMVVAAEGQAQLAQQVQAVTDRLAETTQASNTTVQDALNMVKPAWAK